MKLSIALAIGVVLTLSAGQAGAQHSQDHESGSRSEKASFVIIGTLIDATWFTTPREAPQGEDQITRATNKMAAGNPAALLPEGTDKPEGIWYLLTNPAPLAPYAGKKIKVKGRADRSIRAIEVAALYVQDVEEWREVQIRDVVQKGVPPQKAELSQVKQGQPPSADEHSEHDKPTGANIGIREGEGGGAEEKKDLSHEPGSGDAGHKKQENGGDHEHSLGPLLTFPPVHPLLVNFTAGLFPAALLADLLGRLFRRKSLSIAGWWMLALAAMITPFTALAGWLWYREVGDMGHVQMHYHPWLGLSLALLLPALTIWRGRLYANERTPDRSYLISATIILIALIVQGHLGATMSFGGH